MEDPRIWVGYHDILLKLVRKGLVDPLFSQNIGWENDHSAHPLRKIAHPFPLALLSGCEKILALHVAKWSHKIRHFDTLTLLTGNFR